MSAMGAGASGSIRDEHLIQEMRPKIRQLAEERDLIGLAAIAEMSLRELRMLCERPNTCSDLAEMLDRLDRLNLDALETEAD